MILHNDVHVVEQIRGLVILIPDREAAGVGRYYILFTIHDRRGRQVVDDPVVMIFFPYYRLESSNIRLGQVYLTQNFAELVLLHEEVVGAVFYQVAGQELAQILSGLLNPAPRPAELQRVVVVGDLRVDARELVDLELDLVAISKSSRGHAREV